MSLLKNDGLLPLKKDGLRTIAVVGPVADSQAVLEGNYNGISSSYATFLEGIREAFAGSARVIYAEGSKLDRDRDSNLSQYPNDRLAEAIAATVTIHNEGSVDAEEIVQVFIKADSVNAPRNPRLSGFRHVALKAGEEKRVIIPLDHDLFTVIDDEGHKVQTLSAALYIGGSQLLGKAPPRLKISR